ncbi:hypothetical protein CB1_000544007 [Camelus ferus]|nr:hypothetical protein CB1_000544007 [Camelus ferus]
MTSGPTRLHCASSGLSLFVLRMKRWFTGAAARKSRLVYRMQVAALPSFRELETVQSRLEALADQQVRQSSLWTHRVFFRTGWGTRAPDLLGAMDLLVKPVDSEDTAVGSWSCFPEGTVGVSVLSAKIIASESRSPSLCRAHRGKKRRWSSLQRLLKTETYFITANYTFRQMLP